MNTPNHDIQLQTNEIVKLKKDKLKKIFPASTVFLAILLVVLISLSLSEASNLWFLVSTILAFGVSYIVFRVITKNHDTDILESSGITYEVKIDEKVFKQVYEPGSASLGGVFNYFLNKKLGWFRYENKRLDVYYIVLEEERIDLEKEQYDRLSNMTHMLVRRGKNTNLYLGYEKAMIKRATDS